MKHSGKRTPRRVPTIPAPHGSQLYVVDGGFFDLGLVESIASQFGEPFHYVDGMEEVLLHLQSQPLPVDVVVIDLTLEDADPYDTIRHVRTASAASGIIVLRAWIEHNDGEDCVSFDVYAHTPHPTRLGNFELGILPSSPAE